MIIPHGISARHSSMDKKIVVVTGTLFYEMVVIGQ